MRKFHFILVALAIICSTHAKAFSKPSDCFLNSIPSTVTPTFTQIQPFCEGSDPPLLPSTSLNGIFGTWTPSTISNQVSATYFFTPAIGQDATTTSMNIQVLSIPILIVSGQQNICAGSTTVFSASTAGGTWSSANSNIATVDSNTGLITGLQAGNTNIFYLIPPSTAAGCPAVVGSNSITVNPTMAPPTVNCGLWSPNNRTFSWNAILGATNYTVSYTINGGPLISNALGNVLTYTVNGVLQTDDVVIHVAPSSSSNTCFQAGATGCNISTCPTSGADGSVVICDSSTAPINLYSLITGEDFGGIWNRVLGSGGTFDASAGTFTPSFGATTSAFIYTVLGANPCPNDSSIATVNINHQPNAGFDSCIAISASSTQEINLNNLIGGEETNGLWTRTVGSGGSFNAVSGTFVPDAGSTTSWFTYTISGQAPCINDSSLVRVLLDGSSSQAVNIFCDPSNATTQNSVVFDWNNVGQTSFDFAYTINGGAIVRGNTNLSNLEVFNVPSGSDVTLTVQPVGTNCYSSTTMTCGLLSTANFQSQVVDYFPNPVHDILNLKFSKPIKRVQIANILGQQVYAGDFNENEIQINLNNLNKGCYLVKTTMEDTVQSFKIFKN